MDENVTVPLSLLQKVADVSRVFESLEEELEGYLISQDEELLSRLHEARQDHLSGNVRPFSEIRGGQ